jgi:hypothetical protein
VKQNIMSAFRAVNTADDLSTQQQLSQPQPQLQAGTPAPAPSRPEPIIVESGDAMVDESSVKTPTRDSFVGLNGQAPPTESVATPTPSHLDSKLDLQGREMQPESKDGREMSESTPVPASSSNTPKEAKDGSEQDSGEGDASRPSKKKKGQRFFCTDYPPCVLSFTRSEHLARHIRYVSVFISAPSFHPKWLFHVFSTLNITIARNI